MEYLGKQDEESGYFVGVDDGGWKTSLMMSHEGESPYSGLLGTPQTLSISKAENASFWVTALRHMSPSFQPAAHGYGRQRSQCIVSTILRNLITCRAVDTKDSVIEHRTNCIKKGLHTDASSEICKVDKLGDSAKSRTSGDPWCHSRYQTERNSFDEVKDRKNSTEKSEFTDLKPVPAAYKPVSLPTCSLCGKTFKPENLHSHLKSCRGMKLLRNKAATATTTRENASSWREATSSDKVTDQTSLLCH